MVVSIERLSARSLDMQDRGIHFNVNEDTSGELLHTFESTTQK